MLEKTESRINWTSFDMGKWSSARLHKLSLNAKLLAGNTF